MPRFWTFESRSWLGELRTPTLVIAGSTDPVVPVARVRAVHEAVPGSSFALVPGGHVPSSQRSPEAAAAIRAFLGRL
jgi:pimeloyl-ACP methyl ester carboxylesterase